MDTNVTDILASCAGRTLFGSAAGSIVAIGVVSCLAVGGFTATGAGAALNAQPQNTISIDRTSKGDRLPVVLKRDSNYLVAILVNLATAADRV